MVFRGIRGHVMSCDRLALMVSFELQGIKKTAAVYPGLAYVNGKWNLLDECKSSQELAKLFPPGKLRIKICTGAARFLL